MEAHTHMGETAQTLPQAHLGPAHSQAIICEHHTAWSRQGLPLGYFSELLFLPWLGSLFESDSEVILQAPGKRGRR